MEALLEKYGLRKYYPFFVEMELTTLASIMIFSDHELEAMMVEAGIKPNGRKVLIRAVGAQRKQSYSSS
jgi:hypothetical protein